MQSYILLFFISASRLETINYGLTRYAHVEYQLEIHGHPARINIRS